jgi:hypothetical protein
MNLRSALRIFHALARFVGADRDGFFGPFFFLRTAPGQQRRRDCSCDHEMFGKPGHTAL